MVTQNDPACGFFLILPFLTSLPNRGAAREAAIHPHSTHVSVLTQNLRSWFTVFNVLGSPRFFVRADGLRRHSYKKRPPAVAGSDHTSRRGLDAMRLTLRTLLAWRDGLLQGPEGEELAAKVTEGSVARGLLDRMKALETRTDVEVPRLEGRGLAVDANTVAAYLENTLDPENLEAFERICIESDRHLAEVSECHALLAEASTSPRDAAVSSPLLTAIAARLAGTEPRSDAPREPAVPRGRSGEQPAAVPAVAAVRIATEPAGEAKRRPLPREAKRSSPWLQVAVAVGLLCVAGGGLGVVLWWNPTVTDSADEAERLAAAVPAAPAADAVAAVAEADAAEEPPVAEPAEPAASPPPEAVAAAAVASPTLPPQGATADAESPAAVEPVETVVTPPPAPEPPLGVGPSVPMGDALAIAAPLAPGPEALLPPATAPEPPQLGQPAGGPIIPVVAAAGVLSNGPLALVSELTQPGEWKGLLAGDPFAAGVQLLAPPASGPELDFGATVVRLAPRSLVVVREAAGEGQQGVDIEVVFGKAMIRRTTGDATVTLRAGGLLWQLTGPPGSALATVILSRPPGGDPGADAVMHASLIAGDGGLAWQPLDGSAVLVGREAGGTIPESAAALWNSRRPGDIVTAPADRDAWDEFSTTPERLAAEAVDRFAAAVRDQGDVVAAARQLASSRRIEHRELAAGTLALVGDYAAAVAVLADEEAGRRQGERRWRGFEAETVPLALARGVHSATRLKQALTASMGEDAGERVFQLAIGFSDGQLAAGADTALVAALDASPLIERRYAALRLEEIVEPAPRDQLRYRADAAADLRADGLRWWTVQLEKGLIQRSKAGQLSGPDAG